MRTLTCIAGAALLAASLPAGAVLAQNDDRGRGGENRGRGNDGDRGRGNDGDRGREHRPEARQDRPEAVREVRQDRGEAMREARQDRAENAREARNDARDIARDRRDDIRADMRDRRDDIRDSDRDLEISRDGRVFVFDRDRDRGLINGCPPGLAKRNNGCLPPGQERKIARARYDFLWDRRDDDFDYRYSDGYLYRLNPQGSLMGYLPMLGGALGLGNVWPAQYSYQPAPRYYQDYYRLNDRYDYRYADGVLYGMDPQTQAISQVAALLTGQPWTVGQAMPMGYDVYNVPYAYRDRYVDGPGAMYRYSDGYVYQVDPTTQLVQAVIQLLV